MPIAVYANKTFQVSQSQVYTLNEFALSSGLNTEKQDATNKKPSTYIKGPDLDTISLSIPLDASLKNNIRAEYESWVALKDSQRAYPFILGGKPIGKNRWIIKSVGLSDTFIDNKGNIRKAKLQLEFEEYVRAGSANNSASAAVNSKAPAKKSSRSSSGSVNLVNKIISDNKSTQKRNNTNAKSAVSKGTVYAMKQKQLLNY
ncbi:phage tail protein [Caldanaerobius polysaccharolyticus]|uniref:phage tail protein n=1 Tax=Caldanaerobius polysaccharolyticus TaxID=44256 RepID=UPI00054F85E0|nr:phage tail protein [Caldanaerobius polysaccharolyticus]